MNDSREGGLRINSTEKLCKKTAPKISIITATFNAASLLLDTIKSIRIQSHVDIEWIIIDGGSTDNTLDLLEENEDIIDYWLSEPDQGMYDAIAKGFEHSHGGILCWLNAGDVFLPSSLELVTELFDTNHSIDWLTGMQFMHLPGGKIISCFLPVLYSPDLIRCGAYGRALPVIQQESTFYRRSLLSNVDLSIFKKFKLSGDLYLWYCFSKHSQPTVVCAGLGSFCVHVGQLSEDHSSYWEEASIFLDNYSIVSWFKIFLQLPLQYLPRRIKKLIAGKKMLLWKKDSGWS